MPERKKRKLILPFILILVGVIWLLKINDIDIIKIINIMPYIHDIMPFVLITVGVFILVKRLK